MNTVQTATPPRRARAKTTSEKYETAVAEYKHLRTIRHPDAGTTLPADAKLYSHSDAVKSVATLVYLTEVSVNRILREHGLGARGK